LIDRAVVVVVEGDEGVLLGDEKDEEEMPALVVVRSSFDGGVFWFKRVLFGVSLVAVILQ
jgi:hypothetical protein